MKRSELFISRPPIVKLTKALTKMCREHYLTHHLHKTRKEVAPEYARKAMRILRDNLRPVPKYLAIGYMEIDLMAWAYVEKVIEDGGKTQRANHYLRSALIHVREAGPNESGK